MKRFVAHVHMRPLEPGMASFTVESEFSAPSYSAAWSHVLGMGQKFCATIMSHRIAEVDEDGVINGDEALSLSEAIVSEMPNKTLTVKEAPVVTVPAVAVPSWYGTAKAEVPKPVPFPVSEEADNDSIAV